MTIPSSPPRTSVTVTHADANGTWVIAFAGEHDMATIPLVEQETDAVWARCTRAVIDLAEVTFLDCSMISWLARARDELLPTGHDILRVVHGPPDTPASRMAGLVNLNDEFTCFTTRENALVYEVTETDRDLVGAGSADLATDLSSG